MAQRNYGLDLLRCIAIFMVLVNHGILGLLVHFGHVEAEGWFGVVFVANFISIEWLFVLSGFLIGTMLIRSFEAEGTFWTRSRSFWLRRWFRTIPNYYLFLIVNIALVAVGLAPGAFDPAFTFFSQNLLHGLPPPAFFVESWSLALDEWFYLVAPLLVGLFARVRGASMRNSFVAATATLIVIPMVGRLIVEPPAYFNDWAQGVRMTTVLHLDATGWGVMAAVVGRWYPQMWTSRTTAKAWAGLALMLAGVWMIEGLAVANGLKPFRASPLAAMPGADTLFWTALHHDHPRLVNLLGISLMDVGTLLILPWLTTVRPTFARSTAFVEHVSNYSYSVYLSHYPLLYVLAYLTEALLAPTLAIVVVVTLLWVPLTFALSAANFHLFEKPVSDLRERFTRKVDANPFVAPRQPETMKGLEPAAP